MDQVDDPHACGHLRTGSATAGRRDSHLLAQV